MILGSRPCPTSVDWGLARILRFWAQSPMLLLAVAAKRWGSPGDRPWNITKCANKIDSYVSTARGKPSMVILP